MDFDGAGNYAISRLKAEMSAEFSYHSLSHTVDVHRAARLLAVMEGLSEHDRLMVETAALFHEIGMIVSYIGHEAEGIRIALEVLPDFGYTDQEIELISLLISVTKMSNDPVNLVEKIICDADLDYLGREDYFDISSKLRLEWELLGEGKFDDNKWLLMQLDFLTKHKYYTVSACSLRNEGKQSNIRKISGLIKMDI